MSLLRKALASLDESHRRAVLEAHLGERVSRSVGHPLTAEDRTLPMSAIGLDSLKAVELQHSIEIDLGISFPMAEVLTAGSIAELTADVLGRMMAATPSSAAGRPAPPPDATRLSRGQEALWFLQQLSPDSAAYNVAYALCIRSLVDAARLKRTFQALVDRHSCLRTRFRDRNGRPWADIQEHENVSFAELDARGWSDDRLQAYLVQQTHKPFDLEHGPLFVVHLLTRSDRDHVLLISVHHIAVDFWSLVVLMDEMGRLYAADDPALEARRLPAPAPYAEFARWQDEMLRGEAGRKHEEYWLKQLSGRLPVLELSTDRPRPAMPTHRGASHSFRLNADVTSALRALAQQQQVTLYTLLLAAFQAVLHRYTGSTDVVIGSPMAGRSRADFGKVVGYFTNMVALRGDLSGDPSFIELLDRTRGTVLAALAHQDFPFALLVDRLEQNRDASRSPVFQAAFVLEKPHMREELAEFVLGESGATVSLGELQLESLAVEQRVAQFDLTLMMVEAAGGLRASIQYNSDLFDPATISRLAKHFQTLVEGVVATPSHRLSELPLLSPEEYRQLADWKGAVKAVSPATTLQGLFEDQVERTPDAVALVLDDQQLTYREVNRRANQLAHYLRTQGVGPEVLVGICLARSPELIAAILGVLKAGGAYFPLDPNYPQQRLLYMLSDGGVRLVLSDGRSGSQLPEGEARQVILDADPLELSRQPDENPAPWSTAQNLAYVMYTSGSTGDPNGVAVCQQSVIRLVDAPNYVELTENDVVLQFAPHTFDAATFEVWACLLHGGRLVLVPQEKPSLDQLSETLVRHGVSTLWLTSGLFHQMVDHELAGLRSVRQLLAGGDVLSVRHVQRVLAELPSCRLINGYGPTENTTFTCCHPMQGMAAGGPAPVPIGRPITGTEVFVVDGHQRVVPVGVVGELVTAGTGLARGYLGRPALTAQKFVPSTFSDHAGGRLYRTGDLVRYRNDGPIEFVGRVDHQLKIRGFRVEIGEIETALTSHPAVRAAVVVAQPEGTTKRLVAYLVAERGATLSTGKLRDYLAHQLPDYMVPSIFVTLDSFPLTANGKVDRRALPAPDQSRPDLENQFVAPRQGIEAQLAGIWSELLGVEQVGRHDNFFELGGHSLIGTQVISRIRQLTDFELPLRCLFEQPTVAGLAEWMETASQQGHQDLRESEPLLHAAGDQPPALSDSQERLWLLEQLVRGVPAYNIPAVMRLTGPLHVGALEQAVCEITRRHEVLRARFRTVDGRPEPVIDPPSAGPIPIMDLRSLPEESRPAAVVSLTRGEALRIFDLANDPLIRVSLVRSGDSEHVMFVTMHHVVADGWSIGILTRELASLYKAFCSGTRSQLADLGITYWDYARWQRQRQRGSVLSEGLAYWQATLSGASTPIELPLDRPRTSRPSYRGSSRSRLLGPELVRAIDGLGREYGLTSFMIILGALNVLLARMTQRTDLVVGTVTSGRTRAEIEPLIGCFINFLPLRTKLSGDETGHDLLRLVRTTLLDANAHQECPFQKIVETVQPDRTSSQNPLFNVTFQLENYPQSDFLNDTLRAEFQPPHRQISLVDLRFVATEALTGTELSCEYSTDLFDVETIDLLLDAFCATLEKLVHEPEAGLRSFQVPERLAVRPEAETIAIAATFTAEPVEESIVFWTAKLDGPFKTEFAPYGQVFQQLLAPDSLLATNPGGLNVVLVRLEDWQSREGDAGPGADTGGLHRKVDELGRALKAAVDRTSTPYLVCLCPPSPAIMADPQQSELHSQMEGLLAAHLSDVGGVTLIRPQAMAMAYPVSNHHDPHGNELGHIPYTREFFAALGTTIARHLSAIRSAPYKVIVLDCDQTLWGGVCAEDGPEGVVVDSARKALQEFMVVQQDAGKLLCLCSKNSEADVLEVFDRRPDMPLRRDHLVSWRINWRPKSENLKSLAAELQLGLDSFIFLDDSLVECAEVRANCPEVLTLQVPGAPERIASFLNSVWAFDSARTTKEDKQRTRLYQQNAERERLREQTLTFADFLAELGLEVRIDKMAPHQLPRVAQLIQRTNQFNVSKSSRSEGELDAMFRSGGAECLTVDVADRFGDYGLVGVATFKSGADRILVDTFLLSCRALGRGVEHRMLARLGEIAAERGLSSVQIPFKPTDRNRPALDFLKGVGAGVGRSDEGVLDFVFTTTEAQDSTFKAGSATLTQADETVTSRSVSAVPGGRTSPRLFQTAAELSDVPRILRAIDESKHAQIRPGANTFVAPRSETERLIAGIWEQLLELDRVGIHEDFFALGGHSLLATQVISRLCDLFSVNLELQTAFDAPTIASLAQIVDTAKGAAAGAVMPPVQRTERRADLPLSFAQERLWFLSELDPANAAYNLSIAVQMKGLLPVPALAAALQEVVRRHEGLRTTFAKTGDGQACQAIAPSLPSMLGVIDLRGLPAAEREAAVRRLGAEEAQQPFDLTRGPLLRARVLQLTAEEHVLLFTLHHIVSDGWSAGILMNEFSTLYGEFVRGDCSTLPELRIQYADYAVWQRAWFESGGMAAQLAYWQAQLQGAPAALELPTDYPRPAVQTSRGAREPVVLSAKLSERLVALGRREGVTVFMTVLAAFQTLLHRLTGQPEIMVGTPIAGRNRADVEALIGFFVNTLVMRADMTGDPSFVTLLRRVRETALEAYAHQDLPFEQLVEILAPERDLSRPPLFQVMFVLQNAPVGTVALPDLTLRSLETPSVTSKFDLTLDLSVTPQGLRGALEYNTDLFEPGTIRRVLGNFETLLEGIVADPQRPVSELPLLREAERQQILVEWNDAAVSYPSDACLHRLFEQQVANAPDRTALILDGHQVTYRALNVRANQLATHLRSLGVGPEVRVGLCMERSAELVVGILGILKAGGAYVPLDPAHPPERLAFMVADAGLQALVSEQRLAEGMPETRVPVVLLDGAAWEAVARGPEIAPAVEVSADNIAYVIYTSGSTGKPKGTPVTHRNVARLFAATDAWFAFTPDDVWTLFHSYAFDFSVWEIWGALCYGGRLVLVPYAVSRAPDAFIALMARERVTVLNQTPSAFRQLVAAEGDRPSDRVTDSLRYVVFGGEALDVCQLAPWMDRHGSAQPQLINMYGITETTVHVTYYPVTEKDLAGPPGESPVGRPIPDLQVYLRDSYGNLLPVGVAGEVYVGGYGVARGYLSRPALTAERFVPNPYGEGTRLYKTGDRARYLPHGRLGFLGRIDNQVKIRGFRIELGEIEAVLSQHPGLREAVVLAREDTPGQVRLVAYTVANAESPGVSELRSYLKASLPDYMVPSAFVTLDALPLTTNGKVDRRALPLPDQTRPDLEAAFVPPRNPIERRLAEIWCQVLSLAKVGVYDNFFEIGGHSLLATKLASRVSAAFGTRLPLRRVFERPTICELAKSLQEEEGGASGLEVPPLERTDLEGLVPLSFAQQRLWFLDQMEPGNPYYNMPAALRLSGDLRVSALERAFNEIVRRHEVLRATYMLQEGQPRQAAGPHNALVMPIVDVSSLAEASRQEHVRLLAAADARRPFDLATGPVVRATLIKSGEDSHTILFAMHHIVSDGWSLAIVVRELSALYEAYSEGRPSPLSDLEIQYSDFAVWQRRWLEGDGLKPELAYWKTKLGGQLPTLDIRTDRPRPAIETFGGADEVHLIPKDLARELTRLSARENVTLFMTLVAAYKTLLYRNIGQDDVVIGTDMAGRNQPELEGLVGFFVNLLVLRSDLSGNPTFRAVLARVRETAMGAFAHQDVPFDKLVEELQPKRHRSRTPLFQLLFVMENVPDATLRLPGLTMTPMPNQSNTARFDLALFVREQEDGIVAKWTYKTDLFDRSTITRLASQYRALLESIAAAPDTRLNDLTLQTEEETRQRTLEETRHRDQRMSGLVPGRRRARTLAEKPDATETNGGDTRNDNETAAGARNR